jgi:hypothetical protein
MPKTYTIELCDDTGSGSGCDVFLISAAGTPDAIVEEHYELETREDADRQVELLVARHSIPREHVDVFVGG